MAAALLCCPLVPAQEAAAPTAPAASAVTPAEAEAAVDVIIAAMNELVTVLEGINDKASADAAADKLNEIKTRMMATQATLDNMSSLDEATQQKIGLKLLPAVFMLAPRMDEISKKLESNDCYGSQALQAVMAEDEEDAELSEDCED